MGPAPTLATYQAAASSIYQPQLQADITTAQNTETNDVANEESLKGQVNTDYQTAIDKLTTSTNNSVAKINQLYTERLGGNFSGLQGNDLGTLFATASTNQTTIEDTRANKLAQIATTETNDQNTYNSTVASLTSKYQGEEADYANTQYGAAVKEYNTEQYQQQELALKQESEAISAEKAATPSASATAAAQLAQLNGTFNSQFTAKGAQGKDGYVSPTTYNNLLAEYQAQGGTATQFKDAFSGYANPNQKNLNPNDLYNGL